MYCTNFEGGEHHGADESEHADVCHAKLTCPLSFTAALYWMLDSLPLRYACTTHYALQHACTLDVRAGGILRACCLHTLFKGAALAVLVWIGINYSRVHASVVGAGAGARGRGWGGGGGEGEGGMRCEIGINCNMDGVM